MDMTVDIGEGALDRFSAWCAARPVTGTIRIVADLRTWEALGSEADAALRRRGLAASRTIIAGEHPVAGGEAVLRLLADSRDNESLLVAAGSGTITDIVRFVASRIGKDFVSLPSAPCVDAYASSASALILGGAKATIPAAHPAAVFADTRILAAAPAAMIAAGFGDMLCKLSALADWRLGALLWDEPFDEAVAQRSERAARCAIEAVDSIGAKEAGGIEVLMGALVESGLCMAAAGHSRPASGAEHHFSHFWEAERLRAGQAPILHGLKVAIGTIMAAGLWERVARLSRDQAATLLAGQGPTDEATGIAQIRALFPSSADEVIATQAGFLSLGAAGWAGLTGDIIDNWERIQAIAAGVPGVPAVRDLLARSGCPVDAREIGLGEADLSRAMAGAHWQRDRFTVAKLAGALFGSR